MPRLKLMRFAGWWGEPHPSRASPQAGERIAAQPAPFAAGALLAFGSGVVAGWTSRPALGRRRPSSKCTLLRISPLMPANHAIPAASLSEDRTSCRPAGNRASHARYHPSGVHRACRPMEADIIRIARSRSQRARRERGIRQEGVLGASKPVVGAIGSDRPNGRGLLVPQGFRLCPSSKSSAGFCYDASSRRHVA